MFIKSSNFSESRGSPYVNTHLLAVVPHEKHEASHAAMTVLGGWLAGLSYLNPTHSIKKKAERATTVDGECPGAPGTRAQPAVTPVWRPLATPVSRRDLKVAYL